MGKAMSDPCEYCLNNQQDEYGSWYCAEGGALDEDEMARLSLPYHFGLPLL